MNAQQQLQLEDAQKKLSVFRKHLDLLARCTGESKNVDPNEVLSAVTELQTLVEWAAQKPELEAESAVLLMKLQELHQIRENLEKTTSEADESSYNALNYSEETTIPEKSESYSKDLEYISDIVAANLRDNNGENLEDDNTSMDKDSLGDYSASTEDPNIANAESPQSFEDTNVEIIPSDDKTDNTVIIGEIVDSQLSKEAIDLHSSKEATDLQSSKETADPLSSKEIADPLSSKETADPLSSKETADPLSSKETADPLSSKETADPHSSKGTTDPHSKKETQIIISNEEAFQENPEVEGTVAGNKIEILGTSSDEVNSLSSSIPDANSPNLFRSEVIIIETDEDSKSTEWVNDPKNSSDPLDVCMYAIRNLYESLRVKENELLKLSAMQNDQKHIEALQAVIIDFHKDITNLNTELEKSRKENSMLKEQVLELEESENDARLEAQKLEQKLVFLQEKDSHSQAELSQLKQSLKKSTDALAEKEVSEKELRSQIKYMETLVQKYEDQIKVMEAKEAASSKKEMENLQKENTNVTEREKRVAYTKGTQTYDPPRIKINSTPDESKKNSLTSNGTENAPVLEESKETAAENTVNNGPRITSVLSTSANETLQTKEKDDLINEGNISQKELLKRLHKLIDEDVSLQQQIHYVDEINLAMWKKLQNLDNHIGECKRQNINETNPAVTDIEMSNAGCKTSGTDIQEPSAISANQNIPEENISCLDQNEQYIQERLIKLEEINASFEKELKTRDNLCKEKEKKYEEWLETEKRITDDLKRLADERDWITDQLSKLSADQDARQATILQLEQDINTLKEKIQSEVAKIRSQQQAITEPLNHKVNEMLTKEKEILKMITNLKTEKNRSQGKNELERLKCNYIELQLELSQARDEMRKIEEQFLHQVDQCTAKLLLDEAPRVSELERLRNEKARSDSMISNLKMKHTNLLNALEKQEQYLQNTRESYKKNLEETEEEHRSVETELKSQFQMIEEGTAVATTALMEERMKVEKELKENIEDLKAKEEIYKAKIVELEQDVSHLHEELHKIASESESKKEVAQETTVKEDDGKITEVPFTKADLKAVIQAAPQPDNLVSSKEKIIKEHIQPPDIKTKNVNSCTEKQNGATGENVDELRAQVRELQSELEKISEEEMPPVQPVAPITAKSLKMQKVEDLDYAEVDECSLEAWRKNMQIQNKTEPAILSNVQAVYDDKYSTGYKDNLQNQIVMLSRMKTSKLSLPELATFQSARLTVKEPVEENDYDEVLPRPTNFHVVQQVGSDTLLVGWNYVNPSVLDGFEVYLGDQVHERIYIPDRTKALISGLNLRKPIRLSICALSRYGQMSEPAVLELSSSQGIHTQYLEDDEDYRDIEDPMKGNQRPYSMEW